MKTFKYFILLALVLVGGLQPSFANSGVLRCEGIFSSQTLRQQIIERPVRFGDQVLLLQLKNDGKMIYWGRHQFLPGTEFMASNEFDWLATPFDHKQSDVLVAFGTNSAWEIAVDKNVKSVYLGDWSPYPLMMSAYVVSPLIKLAKNPKEFVVLLSGRIPTKELTSKSLADVFRDSTDYSLNGGMQKVPATNEFLSYLSRQESISDFELKFLTSYFQGLNGFNHGYNSVGPFEGIRHANFAKILGFFDYRYNPANTQAAHQQVKPTTTLEQSSVFSSQANFEKLRALFVEDRIHYGLTSVTDMEFYKSIQKIEGQKSYALSLTNIFDCGSYNGLTEADLQKLLLGTMNMFSASTQNPLVVFRTTNGQPPHGYLRYDLKESWQVNALNYLKQAN
jgi:hypothetical protein